MVRAALSQHAVKLALLGAMVLAGCEKEVILPGEREDIRPTEDVGETVNQSRSIRLAGQVANANWTHGIGTPSYRTSHPALRAAPARVWSANIGAGNTRRQRITAEPIVANGLIYTLDSAATLTATATNGGTVWSTDLTPARDS